MLVGRLSECSALWLAQRILWDGSLTLGNYHACLFLQRGGTLISCDGVTPPPCAISCARVERQICSADWFREEA